MLRAAKRLVATSPRSTIGITPVTTTPSGHDPVECGLGRSAGADDVVDEQDAGARLEPSALHPLLAAALLLLLADREPGAAGHHGDAVRQRVGAHRQASDGVELDTAADGQVGDGPADDRESLPGVDGVLAVDVVVAQLTTGQPERLLAVLVSPRADEIEGGLPAVRSVGLGSRFE